MLVYSKANKASIDRAVAKARKVKPLVRVLGFGHFQVKGSKGTFYEVKFSKNNTEFVVECGCDGNKDHNACYHAAAVSTAYKLQVNQKFLESLCQTCHKIPADSGICEDCQTNTQPDLILLFLLLGGCWRPWSGCRGRK